LVAWAQGSGNDAKLALLNNDASMTVSLLSMQTTKLSLSTASETLAG
jgi:hypothetical protein